MTDSRTIKIRNLEYKLRMARDFIRHLAITVVELKDGETLSKSYWGKQAITNLESTKE